MTSDKSTPNSTTASKLEPLVEPVSLTNQEIRRYSRHVVMPEVGMDGQSRLKAAKVLCIGAGGLGSPALLYLAAAGVGTLGIVDFDIVDETNLQRQIIHGQSDIGRSKALSARDSLAEINPLSQVVLHEERLDSQNALRIIADYDLVVDGTDNFPTRYLVNDACVLLGKPYVWGSIFRFEGQASVFWANVGPCYRCLYPEPPPPGMVPSCAEGGVLGVLCATIGSIQATEAIKVILGEGEPMIGRLKIYDAMKMSFTDIKVRKDDACPICGPNATITELIDYEEFCGLSRGGDLNGVNQSGDEYELPEITSLELKRLIDSSSAPVIVDVREDFERQISRLEHRNVVHIPLGDLPKRFVELDPSMQTVVHCKSGLRSAQATQLLLGHGFTNVSNLVGGINAYAEEVDDTIPVY